MKTLLILITIAVLLPSCGYVALATDDKGNIIVTPITKPIVIPTK